MIGLVVLGAVVGVDRTAFAQSYLAHPLVAATLGGFLAGGAAEGLWLGATLSLLSLSQVPVGERRLRDWSSVALAGGYAVGGQAAGPAAAALLMVVLLGLPAGYGIRWVRATALRRRESLEVSLQAGSTVGIASAHWVGVWQHALRGGLTVWLCAELLTRLIPGVDQLGPGPLRGLELLWQVAPVAGLPLLYRLHLGPRLRLRPAAGESGA
jgi:mannose/fructose/N-acetylgalactosamine-specific phosphotransferase system component IIC